MAKRRCPVCLLKAARWVCCEPCLHVICRDCASKMSSMEIGDCPVCRTRIARFSAVDEGGDVKSVGFANPTPECPHVPFCPPQSEDLWHSDLKRSWKSVQRKLWSVLCGYGIENESTYSLILEYLCNLPKDQAKAAIYELTKGLSASLFDQIASAL